MCCPCDTVGNAVEAVDASGRANMLDLDGLSVSHSEEDMLARVHAQLGESRIRTLAGLRRRTSEQAFAESTMQCRYFRRAEVDHSIMQGHQRKPVASSNPVSDGMCEKTTSTIRNDKGP
ncbi:hypothetical protein COCCADRAFT_29225 [Bipolaris zeicola 26-R-13]|uniref:Uncharacterized protein n=1 Tax=Cochliobolus carbonum (strain 26-R-13) TaxID=930089 RepID=W6Y3W7_COCC2|nr:uncharacterized protein COCCADRAFT_29225 [Bipolaris zeicola 26-R-13]EUC29739.1 hypothetical protein COCCADRAFT_29225 [Bipolaris zeicola 26-R-13]